MQVPTGLLVTFEGIEGSGKSTQIELTRAFVEEQGYSCLVTKEPGGCPLGEEIRSFLLDRGDLRIDPLAELFLIEAGRTQHVAEVIRPALEKGRMILCDRYTDATIAYQGCGRGLDITVIEQMNRWATGGLTPHCTIVLDCPVEVGMARAQGEDRFEREDRTFHQQVREAYLRIARQEPGRVKVVSGQGEQSAIQGEIRRIIRPLFDRR
ncbi:MAG: dTMP kinase [Deltaproteobacteria bacterium RBG_16_54_11]|jgi:dTMP kinase|nr:MAG: dTMP kinase [Deltaproteobacteria bacterium RBG_16_54_11]